VRPLKCWVPQSSGSLTTNAFRKGSEDVATVSPETHVVLLENDRVRVLGVRIKPGEKVAMHSHPANIVYYLSYGKIRLSSPEGRPKTVRSKRVRERGGDSRCS